MKLLTIQCLLSRAHVLRVIYIEGPDTFSMVLTMVYNIRDYWSFFLCLSSGVVNNMTFRKLYLLSSSDEGAEDRAVQWLRLGVSNGHNKAGVSHPDTWGRKQV
jgi:hypothetical protein